MNGVMIINNWAPHASVTDNGSTFLVAGRSYPIQVTSLLYFSFLCHPHIILFSLLRFLQLDFNEVTGDAQILLYWQQGACEANVSSTSISFIFLLYFFYISIILN